jgi:exopolysaccharide biosynthesis operon protein EpsL
LKYFPVKPLAAAALCTLAFGSQAQVQLRASAGIEHDSNVLLVPAGAGEKSDDVLSAAVGLKWDHQYSLQRFRVDVEAATYRYRDLTNLNYSTLNYNAAWDWQLTPRFHGILSADRRQFRDITDTVEGVNTVGRRTERSEVLDGTYEVDGPWRVTAGVSHAESSTTAPLSWDASPRINSARAGVGYESSSGSSVYGRFRHGSGSYTALTGPGPADFKEDEAEAVMKWVVSGKTTVDARLAHLRRTHDGAPQRDFSGPVGSANLTWNITGKTRLQAGLARDLSASGLDVGGHVESTRFFIGPVWNATALTSVNLRFDRTNRNWKDVPAGSLEANREDVVQSASLGVDWSPRRWVTVSASVRNERLTSNIPGANYRNTATALAAKFTY